MTVPRPPDPRVQRTGAAIVRVAAAVAWAVATAACSALPSFQNLIVWNQADQPERITILVDGGDVYSGILGTIDSTPKIVRTQGLAFPAGQHTLESRCRAAGSTEPCRSRSATAR